MSASTDERGSVADDAASDSAAGRTRLPSLTGLRFVAAGLVFAHHVLAPSITAGGVVRLPGATSLAWTGQVGVTLFFVLSGFVLTWSWDPRRTRRGFYGRRVARVYPLHALCWGLALGALALLDRPQPSLGQHAAGLGLVQAWVPDPRWYFAGNGPSWSLSCEAFFYACLPLLVVPLLRATRRALVGITAGCLALSAAVPLLLPASAVADLALLDLTVFPPYRMLEFVVGAAAGAAFVRGWRPTTPPVAGLLALAAAYVLAAALWGDLYVAEVRGDRPLAKLWSDTLVTLPAAWCMVLLASADLRGARTGLASRGAVRLGDWSYAFYLVHALVVLLVVDARGRGPLSAVLALLVSTALAAALHALVERPAERRLRRALTRSERRTSATL